VVAPFVAGMGHCGNDETCLSECQRRIVNIMRFGAPAGALRDHDQRQTRPGDRAVQGEGALKQREWARYRRQVARLSDVEIEGLAPPIGVGRLFEAQRAGGAGTR
jgi:hypothetical protein